MDIEKIVSKIHLLIYTAFSALMLMSVLLGWSSSSLVSKILGIFLCVCCLHRWEEVKSHGGADTLFMTKFKIKNQFSLIIGTYIFLIMVSVVPFLAPYVAWLALVPFIFGIGDAVLHIVGNQVFNTDYLYIPGAFSAILLMLPISVIGIIAVFNRGDLYPSDLLISVIYILIAMVLSKWLPKFVSK